MAIQAKYTTDTGITVPAAYWRVEDVLNVRRKAPAEKQHEPVRYTLNVYASAQAYEDGRPAIGSFRFAFRPGDAEDWTAAAYEDVKRRIQAGADNPQPDPMKMAESRAWTAKERAFGGYLHVDGRTKDV